MITLLRCINGHEWQPDGTSDSAAPCPVCGAERPMVTPPTFPGERPAFRSPGPA
ncbi:MAG: hypothetical protein U0797_19600 [Gemmataceae bacterium]